jgi:FlaA1/EpsC-like NDP-sugar epimerase
MTLSGVKVIGGKDKLMPAVEQYKADVIIIAISKILKSDLKALYEKCLECKVTVKIAPVMTDSNGLDNEPIKLESIKIEQLLGRDELTVRQELVDSCVKGKVILITGGAGSIGSELCRQALRFGCERLIIFDSYENGLFELDNELAKVFDRSRYALVVGNVRDKRKLESVFKAYGPQVVFHAAAYKHVPMMEINSCEAIKTNIFGTLNLINQCDESAAEKFVFISTDKAVNPANIMGATKRVAEMMVQAHGKISRVKMAAVRFGNVVGSNGSAIPIFIKQIKSGGPVTVTHKDIMRYFMTIPEAVSLVLQAGAFANNGEVFVLDMGEPVKIYNLAEDLIRLSGLEPHKDIKIEIVGLRKGEKLFEELRFDNETCDKTTHEGIFITRLTEVGSNMLVAGLRDLQLGLNAEDDAAVTRALFSLVPSEYRN